MVCLSKRSNVQRAAALQQTQLSNLYLFFFSFLKACLAPDADALKVKDYYVDSILFWVYRRMTHSQNW